MKFRLILATAAGAFAVCSAPAALAQGTASGDPAKAQQIVTQVCASCHGADGTSLAPVNPNLAGQHPEYIVKQLANFKAKDGKPAERNNPVMAGMAATLSDDDMKNLAAYFSAQTPKPRTARDPELVKQGQMIYRSGIGTKGIAACASCHSPNGAGMPAQYPRIAGQYAEYTASQLKAFRAGERTNDPNRMMRLVAAKLSDKEIAAVAEFVAGLR